jgi:hypothetical protein
MRDCPERDEFIDAFRTGTAKYLGAGVGSLSGATCETCCLENIIEDAVDLLGLEPDDDDER